MARPEKGKAPDPLGKRALYWAPATPAEESGVSSPTTVLPVGKRALYSGASAEPGAVPASSDSPLTERAAPLPFAVSAAGRCSRVGLLDMVIFQFPIGVWVPRGRYDRRMTCPLCRKRSWCSVTLRRP